MALLRRAQLHHRRAAGVAQEDSRPASVLSHKILRGHTAGAAEGSRVQSSGHDNFGARAHLSTAIVDSPSANSGSDDGEDAGGSAGDSASGSADASADASNDSGSGGGSADPAP